MRSGALLGQGQDTYPLDRSPLFNGHTQHMSAWWYGPFFIVFSVICTSRLEDFSDYSFRIRSELLQQRRICRSDLVDQRLSHLGVLGHNLTHVCQLSRGELGQSSASASTTESARILLPLLLLLLGKLEEIGRSGLLDGLLSRGRVSGGLLRLGLGGLLSGWWRGQLGLNVTGNTLIQKYINCHPRMGGQGVHLHSSGIPRRDLGC